MTTITDLTTPLRHETDPTRFVGRISDLAAAQTDIVVPLGRLRSTADRTFVLRPDEPLLLDDGVYDVLHMAGTRTAHRQVADKHNIPLSYLDRLFGSEADEMRGLGARNINQHARLDQRRALLRLWRAEDGWLLRAVLSDRYQAVDNLDALRAVTAAFGDADLSLGDCEVEVDITPDRFRMRVAVPQIATVVPDLLGDYRMPFSMRPDRPVHAPAEPGETPPVLWAGVEIANSETGGGAFTIAPRAVVQVCRNGLLRPVEFRRTHVGARLDEGTIEWSDGTRRAAIDLVRSQVSDAIATYCSPAYLDKIVEPMRRAKQVEVADVSQAITNVTRTLALTESEGRDLLDCFTRGGDFTLLGVGQAITAAAQYAPDTDRQAEMEAMFWNIVETPALVRA